jgi:ribosomal protein S18 acetylase RimI-like enzyme
MILAEWQKVPEVFDRIWDITAASFDGVELPPRHLLMTNLEEGTIFVNAHEIDCYALLGFKFGVYYIWAIATDPTARGQGFASQLLDEIAAHALAIGEDRIGLATNSDNPAQKLYFDKGYRVTKVLRDFYGPGVHGLFMERNTKTS